MGYRTQAEKYDLVSGFEDEFTATAGTAFQVKRASDNTVVYSGTLTLVRDYDPIDSGERILKADFSGFKVAGEYYISVSAAGVPDSYHFKIGDNVYDGLMVDACRYYYYQRANTEIKAPYVSDFPRADMTPQDFNARFDSYSQPNRDV